MPDEPQGSMEELIRRDARYPPEAYVFLHEGLVRAVKETYGSEPTGKTQHVTGKQLCTALGDLAVERWGMLARTVLARWNIHATIDFGNMVYLLIENNFMSKTVQDSIEDFRDVFDFDVAFIVDDKFELTE